MVAAPLLLALVLSGAPVRLGDFGLTPPEGFRADPELAQGETSALAIAEDGDPERRLLGYFREDGPDPATLALSSIEAPLALDATAKAPLAAAVAGHFKRQLELAFTLERTSYAALPEPRVEVWGTLKVDGRPREVGVAFFAGQHRHAVAVVSLPTARADALRPAISAALASVRPAESPEPLSRRRTAISLVVWGLAAVGLTAARLLRRRRPAAD
jgi:hypothetical protein